jgi:hypothetical protein
MGNRLATRRSAHTLAASPIKAALLRVHICPRSLCWWCEQSDPERGSRMVRVGKVGKGEARLSVCLYQSDQFGCDAVTEIAVLRIQEGVHQVQIVRCIDPALCALPVTLIQILRRDQGLP